jgi:peptidase E
MLCSGSIGLIMCIYILAIVFHTNVLQEGVHALTQWAPHIVYVEGGNTFWLQHCLEKGNWSPHIRAACTGPDATAVYVGKSAGAIIAGATVETATWKVCRKNAHRGSFAMAGWLY